MYLALDFYQVDAIYLNQMKKMTKGVDLIIHTHVLHEGLSVFSPYLVGQNTCKFQCLFLQRS